MGWNGVRGRPQPCSVSCFALLLLLLGRRNFWKQMRSFCVAGQCKLSSAKDTVLQCLTFQILNHVKEEAQLEAGLCNCPKPWSTLSMQKKVNSEASLLLLKWCWVLFWRWLPTCWVPTPTLSGLQTVFSAVILLTTSPFLVSMHTHDAGESCSLQIRTDSTHHCSFWSWERGRTVPAGQLGASRRRWTRWSHCSSGPSSSHLQPTHALV